jgi:hypothetical protein
MSASGPITYRELLGRHTHIEVPMIQRDYAQGRDSESYVRDAFLATLLEALSKPSGDRSLPLNLDFIYGSVEGEDDACFLPLDGQQRLTTLFLLHWYLAWRDNDWDTFANLFQHHGRARFSYSVRPSSNEFFDELVAYRPGVRPEHVEKLSTLISDQAWYFRNWRLDPTIQAVLDMLDALHKNLADSEGLFARLVDPINPAITFHLLDLENFGLSDDLYIKMNARGKPLTAFETFKARYEQVLSKQSDGEMYELAGQRVSRSEYVARQMDTNWADLLWQLRDSESDLFDDAAMRTLRLVALVTRKGEDNQKYLDDVVLLRGVGRQASYTDFQQRGWLDQSFTSTLIALLDTWSASNGKLAPLLPSAKYFNEAQFFEEASTAKSSLAYYRLIQFMAYAGYVTQQDGGFDPQRFQAWMRITTNLAVNTDYNRPDDFRRSALGIADLLPHADNILTHVSSLERLTRGFSDVQLEEEKLKAELMLADANWTALIDRAEQHGYFRGQVGFLLNFSGAESMRQSSPPSEWDKQVHEQVQSDFGRYLTVAELMFADSGLRDLWGYRWQRALLAVGDYLLPSGRNHSFLVDATTEQASWKRLLRGTDQAAGSRELLKQLWDQLSPEEDLEGQLDTIISAANVSEPWRRELVRCPDALAYCEKRAIRRHWNDTIYLLKRSQLNGAHAELFSYCFYIEIRAVHSGFKQLVVEEYESVNDLYMEPFIPLSSTFRDHGLEFRLYFHRGEFRIQTNPVYDGEIYLLLDCLRELGYSDNEGLWTLDLPKGEALDHLVLLDTALDHQVSEA